MRKEIEEEEEKTEKGEQLFQGHACNKPFENRLSELSSRSYSSQFIEEVFKIGWEDE